MVEPVHEGDVGLEVVRLGKLDRVGRHQGQLQVRRQVGSGRLEFRSRNAPIRFGRLDLLNDAYEALARSMHELGSPYHSKAYLRTLAENLADTLEFAVLYTPDGKLAGAGVFIQQGQTITNLHANILRKYRPAYAGEYLYWKTIERYSLKGLSVFDLGRSLIGSGNETFKLKWKPRTETLAYWYALKPGAPLPELNQRNPRFAFAISAWKRLPAFIVRPLGPFLIRGLA